MEAKESVKYTIYAITGPLMLEGQYIPQDVFSSYALGVNQLPSSNLVRLEEDVKMVNKQPQIQDWDLLFTQYTTNIGMEYLVAGVISQVDKIQVYLDSVNSFDAIENTTMSTYQWNNRVDNIGYAWKSYNFTASSYTLNPHYTYIIRNLSNDKIYKLQFVDFYNNQGEKGHIKFRYQSI